MCTKCDLMKTMLSVLNSIFKPHFLSLRMIMNLYESSFIFFIFQNETELHKLAKRFDKQYCVIGFGYGSLYCFYILGQNCFT